MAKERESLQKLYVESLRDLYSAEEQILEALPKMAKATKHPELKRAFQEHYQQTEQQKALHLPQASARCRSFGGSGAASTGGWWPADVRALPPLAPATAHRRVRP